MSINKTHALTAFKTYVAAYDPTNPRISLKIEHTYRVASLCERIAPCEKDVSWLCGLLHDIGRFEQVKRYNTFNDAQSVSHAELGVDVLFGHANPCGPLINLFCDDESLRPLVRDAIATHSAYRLPSTLDERTLMHCNVLRDADKIDIIRVNCERPLQDIYGVTEEQMTASDLSDEVVAFFYQHRTVPRGIRLFPADILVSHLCFAWELVYGTSVQTLLEQGYVYNMLDRHFSNPHTQRTFERMAHHMKEELQRYGSWH